MDFVTSYLELCLRLGRHLDGLVDAYYGPPEISQRIEAEGIRDPASLVADAAGLLASLAAEELAETRERWLRAQLVGLETVARRLAGEEIAYEDEVERCYGVRPEWAPDETFEAAHRELDDLLPGPGSLAERFQAWREEGGLVGDELAAVFDGLLADFRSRTHAMLGLPEGESVEVEYVSDEPWAAFNYYLGDLRSRTSVNTDVSMTPAFLVEVVGHETYPGHHTEHSWKNQLFVRESGWLEETALMIGTPSSLISEGIAGLAVEILLADEEQDVTAAHFADTRVAYDPELSRAVQKAKRPLKRVGSNMAILHSRGASQEEAIEYGMRWGLTSRARSEQSIRFITDPSGARTSPPTRAAMTSAGNSSGKTPRASSGS